MITTIFIFVFVLGLLVFVHEFGHFITAKKMGVRVDEFGFGFPPRIFGIKRGQTLYSINLIPLGGFVKIKGEQGDHVHDQDSFAHKKSWQKVSILSAGVGMNFLLAYALLSFGFMLGIPQEVSDADIQRSIARDVSVIITEIGPGSVAEQVGIKPGDRILTIDGMAFDKPDTVIEYIQQHSDADLHLQLDRAGTKIETIARPKLYPGYEHPIIGIAMVRAGIVRYGFFEAFYRGGEATLSLIILVLIAFWQLVYGLISGQGIADQIAGPVGVAVITGQVATMGFAYLINFTAMLSINLGILNIIPFPALDGGRVLFVVIEWFKGKPVNPKIETIFHSIGFILLITLVAFITYRDFVRYGSQILKGISRIIS